MKAIFNKEIQSFFNNAIGYLLLAFFVITNALLLWFFKGYSNIIHTGFANLNPFFKNSSWIFAFLIPAITMKSFADEYTIGTLEILKTLPLKHRNIVLGKFLAYCAIVCIMLLPTLVFVYSIYILGNPVGNIDLGNIFTAYIGLLFLACTYIAIGLFSSIVTKNSITSFLLSMVINVILYFGFSALGELSLTSLNIAALGIPSHFNSLNRGVIAVKDVFYFGSIVFLFLGFTKLKLDNA